MGFQLIPAALATAGLATAANQSSQLAQLGSLVNANGLYAQNANPFFTDPDGSADASGYFGLNVQPVAAGVKGAVGMLPGSGYPNGVQITPSGANTQEGIYNSHLIPVSPGDMMTGHALLNCQHVPAGLTGIITFNWYDANGTFLSTAVSLFPAINIAGGGGTAWVKLSYPASADTAAPAGAAGAACAVGIHASSAIGPTSVVYITSFCAYNTATTSIPGDTALVKQLLTGAVSGALVANTGLTVGQEIAALIASGSPTGAAGGTPLLHGFSQVGTYSASLAAGSSVNTTFFRMTNCAYVLNFRPQYTTANGAVPFCKIRIRWFTATAGGVDLGPMMEWLCPVNAGPAGTVYSPVLGMGPVRAPFMRVELFNLDPAQAITPFLDVWECTHHISRDDWRTAQAENWTPPPGFTAAPGTAPVGNTLMNGINLTTAHGTTLTYLLPLYAGQAWLSWAVAGTGGDTAAISITPLLTGLAASNYAPAYNFSGVMPVPVNNNLPITLPRAPCVLQISDTGTGSALWEVNLAAMEFVS